VKGVSGAPPGGSAARRAPGRRACPQPAPACPMQPAPGRAAGDASGPHPIGLPSATPGPCQPRASRSPSPPWPLLLLTCSSPMEPAPSSTAGRRRRTSAGCSGATARVRPGTAWLGRATDLMNGPAGRNRVRRGRRGALLMALRAPGSDGLARGRQEQPSQLGARGWPGRYAPARPGASAPRRAASAAAAACSVPTAARPGGSSPVTEPVTYCLSAAAQSAHFCLVRPAVERMACGRAARGWGWGLGVVASEGGRGVTERGPSIGEWGPAPMAAGGKQCRPPARAGAEGAPRSAPRPRGRGAAPP
jgi:hypothetical protein